MDSPAAAISAINVPDIESPELGSAVFRAVADWDAATREERIIAHYFLFSFLKLTENAWYQKKSGILKKGQWVGWETLLRKYYHSRGVQQVWWPNRRHGYSPEFQEFLAGTVPPTDLGSLNVIFDR